MNVITHKYHYINNDLGFKNICLYVDDCFPLVMYITH